MRLLIDTHVFLWALFEPSMLDSRIAKCLKSAELVHVSTITFWENALKVGIGKLKLPRTKPAELPSVAEKTGFTISSPDTNSFASFNELPINQHRDPFDRMLAWQAICENYVLVTADEAFRGYRPAGLKTF